MGGDFARKNGAVVNKGTGSPVGYCEGTSPGWTGPNEGQTNLKVPAAWGGCRTSG